MGYTNYQSQWIKYARFKGRMSYGAYQISTLWILVCFFQRLYGLGSIPNKKEDEFSMLSCGSHSLWGIPIMRVGDFSILISKAACSGGIPNKRGVELSIHASKTVYFESISRALVGKQAQPQLCKFTLRLRLRGETHSALPRRAYITSLGVCGLSA